MSLKPEGMTLILALLREHALRMRAELQRCDLTSDGRRHLADEARIAAEAAAEIEAEGLAR